MICVFCEVCDVCVFGEAWEHDGEVLDELAAAELVPPLDDAVVLEPPLAWLEPLEELADWALEAVDGGAGVFCAEAADAAAAGGGVLEAAGCATTRVACVTRLGVGCSTTAVAA